VSAERHPRRTLRLVARVADIQWEICGSAREAVAREAALLREHRPPFNRAGVWQGAPWWLSLRHEGRLCEWRVTAEPAELGPFRPVLRHVMPSLLRCLLHAVQPERLLRDFPAGWFLRRSPRLWTLTVDAAEAERLDASLRGFLTVGESDWLEPMQAEADGCDGLEAAFWREEAAFLTECAQRIRATLPSSSGLPGPAATAEHQQESAGGDEQG
jgi:hypothetical protein